MSEQPSNAGPLSGVRVLDLTSVVMGPYATQSLGDLGAEVIAVERDTDDTNRAMGAAPVPGLSGVALNLMRNKRGIALDLKHADGRQAFLDLAATSDVVVTNLRPGPLQRLGLTAADIRAVRPDVIFCQAIGHPTDSDDAERPAYDDIIQSASGIGDLFARQGHAPSLLPTLVADKVAGLAIVQAVLAALFHRATTGEGQDIEVPMIDVIRSFVLVEHGAGAIPEPPLARPGYPRILTPQRRPQETSDGWINVLPYTAGHYRALFSAGGRDDLLDDPRIKGRAARFEHADALYREVAIILADRTTDEWLDFCTEHAIPATKAASLEDLVAELPVVDHPVAGPYREVPPPVRYSVTPASVRRPAPTRGADGPEILAELGYTAERIEQLVTDGVLLSA